MLLIRMGRYDSAVFHFVLSVVNFAINIHRAQKLNCPPHGIFGAELIQQNFALMMFVGGDDDERTIRIVSQKSDSQEIKITESHSIRPINEIRSPSL